MTHSRFFLATLLALPSLAAAQTTPQADPSLAEQSPYRWGLGLGAIASDSPFAGEGTRINPVPLILFEGERVFLRGITGGYHIIKGETFSLDAIAALRMDGVAADDLGSEELARNGIDRALLEDRDDSLDLGLVGTWEGAAGEFEFTAKADVTGTSEGYELTARYGYPITAGRGRLTPSVSISHLSKDMANYYYGTLDEEVARGVVDYKPDSATVPTVGVTYVRPIGKRWQFMTRLQYSVLPSKLSDSPLLEPDTDGVGTVLIGFSRGF
ncbi:MipA/OmpV family protein [Xanthomonas hortorum]|uniref:MltA-interacting protein n=1 Tax=Xanthomonas hortorum pv. carotae TaxID=487904 RepID=A0A6V7DM58_9XANT|nr:MipA/OmpV family protein [Xanthomonas hortorum]ETC88096.1 MltA-interacting protein [Xanthomonas hortorum pv. carotae str. M081]CAD0336984.1 MltA-interacting protein [Xanthomonas hortorum pv. carotae]CAD0336992.1 MltA-interacting protein [Xanthomonas hortorum pv. carotae]